MTTFLKSLGGSITPSGTLATRPKTVEGSITPSGVLHLQVNKRVSGRISASGIESPTVAGGGVQTVESGGITLAVGGLMRGPI